VRLQKRRSAVDSSFYALSGGLAARKQSPGWRRHLPPLLFLSGLTLLLLALARPQAQVKLPTVQGTVMLVFDVSASMGATDVQPSRLEAAKAAAREFVRSRPATVQIGIVSFSGSGFTVQSPTHDENALLNAINRLQPTSGTSLGQGILAALRSLAVEAGFTVNDAPAPTPQSQGQGASPGAMSQDALLAQLPEGAYPASLIVLLSDGENTESFDPSRAALAAAEHAVRVDALGFGTTAGADLQVDGYDVHSALDEGTLQDITQNAGGTYYPPQDAQGRKQVFANLTSQLVIKSQRMEITALLAGASIVVLLAGSLLSMAWFNRLP